MRVGIIQSNYLPWRGYFDFIDDVDLFIVHDDLQFTKGDWRSRNRIKTRTGLQWLTVPVHYRHTAQRICDTDIDYSRAWDRSHLHVVQAHYREAPYLSQVLELMEAAFADRHRTISDLNVALIRAVNRHLGIPTPLRWSWEFSPRGSKTERLIELLSAVQATTYVSGPSAKAYLDESQFERAGIHLEFKSYCYPPYPQQWGGFESAVSVIDLIANCGPEARQLITSHVENERAA